MALDRLDQPNNIAVITGTLAILAHGACKLVVGSIECGHWARRHIRARKAAIEVDVSGPDFTLAAHASRSAAS